MAIGEFKTKQEEKLFYALNELIAHCVDSIGLPKKPTTKQIKAALDVLTKFKKQSNPKK